MNKSEHCEQWFISLSKIIVIASPLINEILKLDGLNLIYTQ